MLHRFSARGLAMKCETDCDSDKEEKHLFCELQIIPFPKGFT